ncbi:hypothetical protein U6Y00_12230, partial [Cutibacterium acnes]
LFLSSSAQYNHLLNEQRLNPGDSLVQGKSTFTMQHDCNLVLYQGSKPVWASGTYGKGSGCYAILQNDGNFVVYNNGNHPVWATNTNGRGSGNYILIVQRDSNVVLYTGPLWASGTNRVGAPPVVIASPRNGTVGITGAQQNKVSELLKADE